MKKFGQGSLFDEPHESKRWHRVHAAPATGRGGCSLDIGPVRLRGDGGDQETKRELAYRLAVCWNVAEGWPTKALEAGVLRSVGDALVQLLELLDQRSQEVSDDIHALGNRLSLLLEERNTHYDLTDGRPHDCATCLAKPGLPGG
ncbi:MAG: hypothetical protein HKN10_04905 [Myxococcales bacterium]|nr:hypothetical protein [Myxococcales bacterium]